MSSQDTSATADGWTTDRDQRDTEYLPPRVERLGSLAELTLGGKGDPDDGFGGAGDEGSV